MRRYDRRGDARPHRVSAFAMMRHEIVRAQNEGDYKMLFDLLDKICCDPGAAKIEMFRRMLFNIAVNNLDDHLKNFEFLLDEERPCWQLSPAYDLTIDPYPNRRITSVFGMRQPTLGDETMERIIPLVGLAASTAYAIRDQIAAEVTNWPRHFEAVGVSPQDIDKLRRGMSHGLKDVSLGASLPHLPARSTLRPE